MNRPSVDDDQRLIEAALGGASQAFGQLVLRYQDRLFNTLVRVIGNADDAQDVAQDAFVQAFLKLNTFQHTAGFYTWLYRIAFNLAVSRQRRRKPTASVEHMREEAGHEPVDNDPPPSRPMEQAERAEQVQAALAQLSDEHRSILVLREIDGLDYQAIAEILDLEIGTVRSRLFRARMQLREQLKEVVEEDVM